MVLFNSILVLLIIAAVIAVEARNQIASVIAVAAAGLSLSLLFLLLHAPDLAIILLIVEVITLAALAKVAHLEEQPAAGRCGAVTGFVVVLFLAIVAAAGYHALQELPEFGTPLAVPVAELPGTTNAVAAAFCGYRLFDTLVALMVLAAAAGGALLILQKKQRNAA
jgi:multisubunit Na+/H+ antiporter MnhB subunit